MTMNNILKINNLQKKYHTPNNETFAIGNINLYIVSGEYVSIFLFL